MKKALFSLCMAMLIIVCVLSACNKKIDGYYIYQDNILFRNEYEDLGHITNTQPKLIDEFSIIYDNKDGTKSLYVFSAPIAYMSSEGRLTTADNKLIESTNSAVVKSGYKYQNKSNDAQIYFPATLSPDKKIIIANSTSYIQVAPNNIEVNNAELKTIVDIYGIERNAVV